uniref:Uncharacterized protein n=1 Tax=Cucumis sativus TaxID=3659 RepID=A0A0A0KHE2_CUCSA
MGLHPDELEDFSCNGSAIGRMFLLLSEPSLEQQASSSFGLQQESSSFGLQQESSQASSFGLQQASSSFGLEGTEILLVHFKPKVFNFLRFLVAFVGFLLLSNLDFWLNGCIIPF